MTPKFRFQPMRPLLRVLRPWSKASTVQTLARPMPEPFQAPAQAALHRRWRLAIDRVAHRLSKKAKP